MIHHYDKQGKPLPNMLAWARLREDESYYRIASDHIGEVWVSTVWLGIDMSLGMVATPPLIFETMVFPDCDYCVRTCTEAAALAQHDQAVAWIRSGDYERQEQTGEVLVRDQDEQRPR